jgi:acyl dehydratase
MADVDGRREQARSRTVGFGSERVRRWAALTRDGNPLHLDPDFAAGTRFGVPIVHGHLLASVLLDTLQAATGEAALTGQRISVRFRAPVPVGGEVRIDHVTARAAVDTVRVTCDGTEVLEVEVAPESGRGREGGDE